MTNPENVVDSHRRHSRGTKHQTAGHSRDFVALVLSFDRELNAVDMECSVLARALTSGDLEELERAAYTLVSAWLRAESDAMRIIGTRCGIAACQQFARAAITACSVVVTAQFGRALAETSKWSHASHPDPAALRGLRAVLGQLSARVDIRISDVPRSGHAPRGTQRAAGAPGLTMSPEATEPLPPGPEGPVRTDALTEALALQCSTVQVRLLELESRLRADNGATTALALADVSNATMVLVVRIDLAGASCMRLTASLRAWNTPRSWRPICQRMPMAA